MARRREALKAVTRERKASFLVSLENNLGVITYAAKATNVSREAVYIWMREDEEFAAAVKEIERFQFDYVEMQLLKKIKEGSEKSIIFYLATKGAKFGYGSPYAHRNALEGQMPSAGLLPSPVMPDEHEILHDRAEMDDDALVKAMAIAQQFAPGLFPVVNGNGKHDQHVGGGVIIDVPEEEEEEAK